MKHEILERPIAQKKFRRSLGCLWIFYINDSKYTGSAKVSSFQAVRNTGFPHLSKAEKVLDRQGKILYNKKSEENKSTQQAPFSTCQKIVHTAEESGKMPTD